MSSKNGGGSKAKDVLKSILSHNHSSSTGKTMAPADPAAANELDEQLQALDLGGIGVVVPEVAVAAASPPLSPKPNNSNTKIKNKSSEYFSNKKLLAKSISMQEADDKYMENIMLAKDRRTSWQQVRSQRSFVPSLSAICKYNNNTN